MRSTQVNSTKHIIFVRKINRCGLPLLAVGILGATVMPHALFLGSSLATQDRVSDAPPEERLPSSPTSSRTPLPTRIRQFIRPLFRLTRADRAISAIDYRSKYGQRANNSYSFIRAHLSHGVADVVFSLLALAVPINSALVCLPPLFSSH